MESYHEIHYPVVYDIQDITTELDNNITRNPPSVQPVQFLVKFVYRELYKYINSLNMRVHEREVKINYCQFDMDTLKNYGESHKILSGYLVSFGIRVGDNEYMVEQIIKGGLRIGNRVSYMGRKVLGLCVNLKREHLRYRCEACTLRRRMMVLRRMPVEALIELDRMQEEYLERLMNNGDDDNKGMVPASDSSIEKVLKRVRVAGPDDKESSSCDDVEEEAGRKRKQSRIGTVSEGESCTVCMEEFKGRSEVACMPCSHVFHDECIVTGLRQSHYCPICRFEVPTA